MFHQPIEDTNPQPVNFCSAISFALICANLTLFVTMYNNPGEWGLGRVFAMLFLPFGFTPAAFFSLIAHVRRESWSPTALRLSLGPVLVSLIFLVFWWFFL